MTQNLEHRITNIQDQILYEKDELLQIQKQYQVVEKSNDQLKQRLTNSYDQSQIDQVSEGERTNTLWGYVARSKE